MVLSVLKLIMITRLNVPTVVNFLTVSVKTVFFVIFSLKSLICLVCLNGLNVQVMVQLVV